ncbi:MAG: GAF domain-containing protein [Candidatus Hodarchaeota archaeon]
MGEKSTDIVKDIEIKYITKLKYFIEEQQSSLNIDFDKYIFFLNEEASLLFCYLVKDSYEFMDSPEKVFIKEINLLYEKQKKKSDKYIHRNPTDINYNLLNSCSSAQDFFEIIIRELKNSTAIRCIQLLIVNPNNDALEVKLYSYIDHLPMYDVAHEGGIIYSAKMNGKSICVNSVYDIDSYDIFDATIKSELAVPIFLKDEVIAVLNFEDVYTNRFSKEFIQHIEEVTSFIGSSVEKYFGLRDHHKVR